MRILRTLGRRGRSALSPLRCNQSVLRYSCGMTSGASRERHHVPTCREPVAQRLADRRWEERIERCNESRLKTSVDRPQMVDATTREVRTECAHDPPNDVAPRPERWPAAVPVVDLWLGRLNPSTGRRVFRESREARVPRTSMPSPRLRVTDILMNHPESQYCEFVEWAQIIGVAERKRGERTEVWRQRAAI